MPIEVPTWEDTTDTLPDVPSWDDTSPVSPSVSVKPGPRSEWPLQETPVESLSQQPQTPPQPFDPTNRIIEPNRAPMLQPVGEASTTFGGPPKPVASFAETTQEVKEKMMEPRINMPKFTISEQDSKPVTFGKEVLNLALGIPEFLSSNAGLLSMVSGAVAPTATSAVFTVDMLNNLGQQVQAAYKDWDRMTPTQKTVAVADMVGTGVLTGMLAKHTTTGVLNKVVPARQVAQMINKAELTPNAQAAAESIGGNLPAIVRPGERQPALEIVKPVEEAKPTNTSKTGAETLNKDIVDIAISKPWNLGYSIVMPEAEAQFYFPSKEKAVQVLGNVQNNERIQTLGDLMANVADSVGKELNTGQKGFQAFYRKPSEIEAGSQVNLALKNPLLVREPYGYGFDEADIMAIIRDAIAKGHDGVVILNEGALPKNVRAEMDRIFEQPTHGSNPYLDAKLEALKQANLKKVDWQNGEHTIITFDRTAETEAKPLEFSETEPTPSQPISEAKPTEAISLAHVEEPVKVSSEKMTIPLETVKQGDTIRFEPDENRAKRYGEIPVQGVVQDVIRNQDGEIGFNVWTPVEGDPSRVVRIWSNRGKVVSREAAQVATPSSGSTARPSEPSSSGRTPQRAKSVVEIADEIAAKGVDPQASYGLFVKARDLKPEISAREWLPIYRKSLELANLSKQIAISKKAKPPPVAQGEAAQSAPPSAPAVSQAEPGVAAPEAQAISQAKPTSELAQPKVKEPWEMTKEEYALTEPKGDGKREVISAKVGPVDVKVIKNPTPSDYQLINAEHELKYPNDNSGDPKTRFTIDSNGNRYIWPSSDASHSGIEGWLKDNLGITANQNTQWYSHGYHVRRALFSRKPVPPEVLADYPDLKQPIPPTEQAAGGEMIGMGGARPGEVPQAPQIVQLTEEMNRIEGKKVPFGEKVKESFNLNEHRSLAQDAAGRALDALKATRDYIIKKWDGVSDWDQIKKVKGELSAEINTRGWSLKEFEKSFRKAIPSKADREAISSWLDTGGDPAKLQTAFAETTPRYKASYQRAMNLSPELQAAANHIRSYFEARLQEAIDAGVVKEGIEDYIHRIYQRDTPVKRRILNQVQSGVLNTRTPGLAMQRAFEFDYEAEKAGYPIVKDALARVVDYERSLSRVIADRKAVKKFMEIKMPDGRPMVDVAGIGIPLENAEGVTEAMLIKPSFKRGDPNEPGSKNYRKDYLERNDYPAFRKWKWIDKDEATGRDVFLQGDVLVHPDAAQRIDALMARSALRRSKALSAALGVSSAFKQTMLDFSGFHQVQIAVHGAEHRVQPRFIPQIPGFVKTIENINISDPKVQSLLKGGLEIGGDNPSVNYREGLVGRSLSRMIPGLGELMQSYHEYLFRDYIPRIKTTMALHALERNRQRFPNMSEEQLNYLTAKQANAAFGGLNYILMERSKTAQDLSRLILLAPDFLEARGAFAAQALQRVGKGDKGGFLKGNEQRQALLLGALTLYVTARIMNKLTDDQYHFEPENAFSIVHDGHAYSLRTVQGDLLHLWDKPFQFWLNRLNPVFGRSFLELGTGRDYFGRKRSRMELAWDLLANITPIAFRNSQERKLWESALNAFGVQAKRWSDIDDAFKLAQTWKEKNGVQERGEFIYDSEKDPLRPLKLALNDGDEGEAAKQIRLIFENNAYNRKKLNDYFRRYQSMPFTGSKANDQKFMATLNEDQKQTVERARQHRRDIMHLYFKALGQYDSAMSKPQL